MLQTWTVRHAWQDNFSSSLPRLIQRQRGWSHMNPCRSKLGLHTKHNLRRHQPEHADPEKFNLSQYLTRILKRRSLLTRSYLRLPTKTDEKYTTCQQKFLLQLRCPYRLL